MPAGVRQAGGQAYAHPRESWWAREGWLEGLV